MDKIKGSCYCENVVFEMELSKPSREYGPRSCDCDFCQKHGAAYVSDPHGSLAFRVKKMERLRKYRQDAVKGIAEFLHCADCGVLVGVIHRDGKKVFGAVNALAVDGAEFGEKTSVSPRLLPTEEKTRRWKQMWFPNVRISRSPAARLRTSRS